MSLSNRPLFILLFGLALTACQKSQPPVGALRVEPVEIKLAYPHYESLALEVEMDEPLPDGASPMVMVHLLDDSGVVRTFDHALPGDWVAGESQRYSIQIYQSALAPPLEPGSYTLTAGIYDAELGRFPLAVEGSQVDEGEYVIAAVEAAQGSGDSPKFFFSPNWLPTEAGTDVQILGRRWLQGEGTLRLRSLGAAGTVRLDLRIEAPDEALEDLVLSDGFEEPQLDVTTTCGEATWSFVGFGTHVMELPIEPEAADEATGECELSLTPHYQVVTRRNLNSKSLALDLLAWTAD